jgi:hypothetical protein
MNPVEKILGKNKQEKDWEETPAGQRWLSDERRRGLDDENQTFDN